MTLSSLLVLLIVSLILLWPMLKISLTRFARWLPGSVRYPITVLLFWPTVLINRVFCYFFPSKRRLWDRVHPTIVLGSVPCLAADVDALVGKEHVTSFVNLCREWDSNAALYKRRGLSSAHAPTIDFDAPTIEETLRCVDFIHERAKKGESVFVHCKAGRGRSVCIVLAYLVLHEGLSPKEADARIRKARPHISKKWHLPLLTEIARRAEANATEDSQLPSRAESPTLEQEMTPLTRGGT